MMKITITLLLFICSITLAVSSDKTDGLSVDSIDHEVQKLMQSEDVQGMALAYIEKGEIKHVAAYGHRNVEQGLPLTTDTIMYAASLTKTAFTYLLLQLVDEGRLNLDTSIAELLPRPLVEYREGDYDYSDLDLDDRWRLLTPRILLTHSSGFANFRWVEVDQKLRFHFDPGSRYGYSAEGFYILQLILEEGLGLDVKHEMQTRVFNRFAMSNSSMSWRADFANNLADGYGLDGVMEPHDERDGVSAAGSMDTSISDQARLWAGIVRGDGLSQQSRLELIKAQMPVTSKHQFPTLTSEVEPSNEVFKLSAGLGLVSFEGVGGKGWFKGGHNPWTANMVICLENDKSCLVMLGNDVRAERIYPQITELVLGKTSMPWRWEYSWLSTTE